MCYFQKERSNQFRSLFCYKMDPAYLQQTGYIFLRLAHITRAISHGNTLVYIRTVSQKSAFVVSVRMIDPSFSKHRFNSPAIKVFTDNVQVCPVVCNRQYFKIIFRTVDRKTFAVFAAYISFHAENNAERSGHYTP